MNTEATLSLKTHLNRIFLAGVMFGSGLSVAIYSLASIYNSETSFLTSSANDDAFVNSHAITIDNNLFSQLDTKEIALKTLTKKTEESELTSTGSTQFAITTRARASEQCELIKFEHISDNELVFNCSGTNNLSYTINYNALEENTDQWRSFMLLKSVKSGSAFDCSEPREAKSTAVMLLLNKAPTYNLCMSVQVSDSDKKSFLSVSPDVFIDAMPKVIWTIEREFARLERDESVNPVVKNAQHEGAWQQLKQVE
ncbi:hypothetical protein LMH73_011685 [Vibrio splendidus]|nr:hypothetical protein [Vibrio splendidus]MCC4883306.1 hypothetical protein [Vibrio splendidus]